MEERLLGSEVSDTSDWKGKVWVETKKIWNVGFPAMLARVSQFGMFVVTQAFIGHVGEQELAGYALVQIIIVRFANGILIFRLLQEEKPVANVAGYISLWFIPILYFFTFGFSIQKYLQTQLKNKIVGWVSAVSFVLHVLLSWIFVSKLNLGIPGAMSAMIISSWLIIITVLIYILGGWCPYTWKGFTLAAFSDLAPAVKLSISSGVMLCLEFWYTAILVLLAAYVKDATTQISAMSICLNVTAWEFQMCLCFLAASSVRVANELGRGDAKAAKFSVQVNFIASMCLGILFFILCLVFRRQLTTVFTNSETVIEAVSDLSLLLAFSVLLNSVQSVLTGVAVGCGRQSMAAYVNITCYYVVGVPVGLLLAYVAHLQVKGLWIGMILGVLSQVLVLGYITLRTNWDEQVKKASERLNRWSLQPSEEPESDTSSFR